jgi:hypothetical protein
MGTEPLDSSAEGEKPLLGLATCAEAVGAAGLDCNAGDETRSALERRWAMPCRSATAGERRCALWRWSASGGGAMARI